MEYCKYEGHNCPFTKMAIWSERKVLTLTQMFVNIIGFLCLLLIFFLEITAIICVFYIINPSNALEVIYYLSPAVSK
jgi:hypothetical protein